ncbi:hypothetical protein GGX14DRAFT_414247 [Mycena pura]|uniref:Acetyl-CoA synthetase-like protein n=1 Tax=Mycena pura TaxID=153505 RepID=A0AAD6YTD0_9AGAR|nr:hypothetical protein GGX14DRAFT_414247 [Mycena pura]
MSNTWHPKRTLAETEAILCAPGMPNELETRLIDGQIQRVYKNLWPSVCVFWLWASDLYAESTYCVFENQRYTYKEIFDRSLTAAAIYNDIYAVKKGDRVGICSRNYPEYLVAFWACHLIGAVAVLANAWLPSPQLVHCLSKTQCKLIILDAERADLLQPVVKKLIAEAGATGILVFEDGKGPWKGMQTWGNAFRDYKGDPKNITKQDFKLVPEDNATIFFTSAKGVLSTQRQFLTNTFNTLVSRRRASLRRGEDIPTPSPEDPQAGALISVPLFHVTMSLTLGGAKIVLLRKWNPQEAARLIRQEKLTGAGGVPSMCSDLMESELAGYSLDSLSFGGAPTASMLTTRAVATFPNVTLYGMTECNSIATSLAGEDWITRPTSCGLPSPVNDILIVKDGQVLPRGQIGEIWIRGSNVMKGYWGEPAATEKILTKDGWLMSGDLGFQDEEGFVYVRDRIKDIIIRGGENIDSTTVENALFTEGVLEVAAVAVPDERLGELVSAVVTVKPDYRDKITEQSLKALASTRLPGFAVPVMIIFQAEMQHNPAGKILKGDLRKLAAREWEKRNGQTAVKHKL